MLDGHRLIGNHSRWINFVTVRNAAWHHENVVLLGDAAHTAHFSIGSGTKLALEDSIGLAWALREHPEDAAALAYEADRRPIVESTQRAAQGSLEWFEGIARYVSQPPVLFAFNLLTRSRRITYGELQLRDPGFVEEVDAAFGAVRRPPMFTPFRLRELELANRVVVSPMDMYSSRDGTPGDFHLVHLGARGLGGAGLVMTEMICVSREGRITPGCGGLYADEHTAAWARIVDFVHANGGARIGAQIGHSGRKGSTKLMWEGEDEPLPDGNWPLLAPSPLPYLPGVSQEPREMGRADMDAVRDQHVAATRAAAEAGFDLLELHMAHGYLLSSFLSPLTNRRADDYGGDLAARARYPLEVFAACRAAWPAERPMSVRISASDWVRGRLRRRPGGRPSPRCCWRRAATSSTSPPARCRPTSGRPTAAASRRRSPTGSATRSGSPRSRSARSPATTTSTRSSWPGAPTCARSRARTSTTRNWTLHAAADQGYDLEWVPQYRSGSRRPNVGKGDGIRRAPVRRFGAPEAGEERPPARWRPQVTA